MSIAVHHGLKACRRTGAVTLADEGQATDVLAERLKQGLWSNEHCSASWAAAEQVLFCLQMRDRQLMYLQSG